LAATAARAVNAIPVVCAADPGILSVWWGMSLGRWIRVRMRFDGIVDGERRAQFSAIWSMPDEPVEDWEPGIAAGSATRRPTRITIDGDPPVQVDFAQRR